MRILGTVAALLCPLYAQVDVPTANYDNERTNATLGETILNTSNVNPAQFGKLYAYPVDGQVYAQPLYIRGLTIPGSAARNILYVVTMHNSVYAFDAEAGTGTAPIWKVNFGDPVDPATILTSDGIVYTDIKREIGILSTPVIDRSRGAIYVVHQTRKDGKIAFFLHALDLATGSEKLDGPVEVRGGVPGTGWPGAGEVVAGQVQFRPEDHIQRPALLLANGSVHVAFGSHGDFPPFHGWMMAYDAGDLTRQTAVFNTTPDSWGGSIWQSGRGPAADSNGDIYLTTGNGAYDGQRAWSQSILRLDPTLQVLDSFTPSDWKALNDDDEDVGSSGAILIPGNKLVLAGSKEGKVSVADRSAMGRISADDSQIFQRFQAAEFPVFAIFNAAVWKRPDEPVLYVWGYRDALRAFRMENGQFLTAAFSSNSSVQTALPFHGMSVSSNASVPGTGILWITSSTRDSNKNLFATLHAFDATDVSRELWSSDMRSTRDVLGSFTKFGNPTVANGRVYVPTDSQQVVVYGLFGGPGIDAVVNSATFRSSYISGGELITIFGKGVGAGKERDLSVTFDGIPAPILFTSPNQLNTIVPFGVSATNRTVLKIGGSEGVSYSTTLPVSAAAPGLFSADSSGSGQGAILNQDLTLNSAANPAARGSAISLYGTGLGPLVPPVPDGTVFSTSPLPLVELPVSVTIGGEPAKVTYQGSAMGLVAGVVQVNVEVPETVVPGPAVPVTLAAGGTASDQSITVAVK